MELTQTRAVAPRRRRRRVRPAGRETLAKAPKPVAVGVTRPDAAGVTARRSGDGGVAAASAASCVTSSATLAASSATSGPARARLGAGRRLAA